MTEQHPITVPTGSITCWKMLYRSLPPEERSEVSETEYIATQAARWGADQELEAGCEWLRTKIGAIYSSSVERELRATRRPKPPSLKGPTPQPADGEVAASIIELRASAAMLERTLYVVPSNHCRRAASLLERLDRYDQALSAVMPPDFKDWWQNSKDEWPDVAAGVIENLRKREELAWEQVGRLMPQQSSKTKNND